MASPEAPALANVEMAAAWDGPEGDHWTEHAARYESTSEGYPRALLEALPLQSDHCLLDIGCGTGKLTRAAARVVSSGRAVGIDLSNRMLEHARLRADADGVPNARFVQGDAQVYPFEPEGFDFAISSFGAMFFADPVAAFTNIGAGLRPGGTIALLGWRELQRNEWVAAIRDALAMGRDLPLPPSEGPGPFSFADRERTASTLEAAGFGGVTFTEVDEPIRFGDNTEHAYEFVSTFGITRGLTHDLDDEQKAAALESLRSTLAAHETAEGVRFGSSAWLIRAERVTA